MSNPSKILNLNEMMEDYIEVEEKAVHETKSGAVQIEEIPKVRTKMEQPTKETRKRKGGAVEARIEQRNE